jgi:hypothetical protein
LKEAKSKAAWEWKRQHLGGIGLGENWEIDADQTAKEIIREEEREEQRRKRIEEEKYL